VGKKINCTWIWGFMLRCRFPLLRIFRQIYYWCWRC